MEEITREFYYYEIIEYNFISRNHVIMLQYINNNKHNLEQCPISSNKTPKMKLD
jgi:hypothetical protein